ncbi:MAG: protein kinase [Kofleriaceae bacterium]|nr:protein kinase [Kofleriaceae bacterium]
MADQVNTLGDRPGRRGERLAALFASPASVLVILPVLVISVGVVVLLLGRKATSESAEMMARSQLLAQADEVSADVKSALDQSDPVLSGLRTLAEPALPTPDAAARLRDIVIGRSGITNASIVFPSGVMWGSYFSTDTRELRVQETRVADRTRTSYALRDGQMVVLSVEPSQYEPLQRPQYLKPVEAKRRVWLPPRTFETSHRTGVTVSEPVLAADGTLIAVVSLDFDVAALSRVIGRPPLPGARTVMFTRDGTILAFPGAPIPEKAAKEKRLLRYEDYKDPALTALFARIESGREQAQFAELEATDGARYFMSLSVVARNGAGSSLDWYLATLVPESALFSATKKFGRDAIIASAAALAIALGVALMFAWNLLRMRRAVGVARAEARSAQERARKLGSYQLVARLGSGGMGEVWRAQHQLLAREAAIKLVRPDALSDPSHAPLVLERFRREAQTLASLRSRHTIELYDYGTTDDGAFFFVMELLDGLDLAQLVRHHGPQPAARVISIIAQACQSLAEAHDAGLLHRDIKPANLYLCRAADEVDIIKLLDFGIVHNASDPLDPVLVANDPARPIPVTATSTGERLTAIGVVVGTPGYIPPEQAIGEPLDARGDLYALGCVAWILLTGNEVFPGDDGDEVLHQHVTQPLPTLRDKVRGWLPKELEDLVLSCLAKQPRSRPPDARALADALYAIEIPPEHAWTRKQAIAWWSSLRPTATAHHDEATARGPVVPMPGGATRVDGVAGVPPRLTVGLATAVDGGRVLVPQRDKGQSLDLPTVMSRPSRPD